MSVPDLHAIFLIVLTPIMFYLFTRDSIPISTTALSLLVVLALVFSIFPYEGPKGFFRATDVFSSFGNEALIAICSLMILGRGLTLTGALEPVARFIAYLWRYSKHAAMLFVLLLCLIVSGFLNDTPIVVLMIPILMSVAERTKEAVSKTLLPMNYAVLIGGMSTTIGTSTNILVVSIATGLGVREFAIFEFTHVTALAAAPALLYLWLVAPRILPALQSESIKELRLYDAWLHVPEESAVIGLPLHEILGKAASANRVLEIKRGNTLLMRFPTLKLQEGDRLLVRDTRENLNRLSAELKLPLHNLDEEALNEGQLADQAVADLQLAELVVSQNAALVGSTIKAERLAERTGFIVLGLRPAHAVFSTKAEIIGNRIIHPGDVLLVQSSKEHLEAAKHSGDFLVLDGATTLPRSKKAPLAIVIMAAVVLVAVAGILHISVAAFVGALLMLVTSCVKWEDIAQSLSTRVVLIVAASLALGAGMSATGGSDFLAAAYVSVSKNLPPEAILSSLILLMAMMTNFVSNNAAAAIGTPIAISIATQLGLSPEPFVLAVLFGANLCYVTPMGYQTNMLVMGAAGYRFKDFVITGFPLLLIMWGMYTWLLPKFYPLTP